MDFPRVPLTSDWVLFCSLANFGLKLLDLHAHDKGEDSLVNFPVVDGNQVDDVRYQPPQGKERGRVWINDKHYFEGVPPEAWGFLIGGYFPAQRWLKDRVGRTLHFDDTAAYARIISALVETKKLMAEIDGAIEKHGGWPLR